MKHIHTALFSIITLSTSLYCAKSDYKVIVETKWQNLQQDANLVKKFGGKWILAGSITFKKKSKNSVEINQIHLHWQGKTLDHLNASLYKKTSDTNFIPIEKNLLCDSCWNKKTQTLLFNFDKKQTLGPVNVFYLVLTVPESIKHVLKEGQFTLQECCLPNKYKHCATDQAITLNVKKKNSQQLCTTPS